MENKETNTRRGFLKQVGLAGATLLGAKAMAANQCIQTPAQTAGPFYPGQVINTATNDLTVAPGRVTAPIGEVINIQGIVQDENCNPIPDVNVEIWQACASGKYNHLRDPNPAKLDPNFNYWGETFTNADGLYQFTTIKPGAYPAAEAWDRPPHIHFRISKRGYKELVTQMYFDGDPLNDVDLILQQVPARMRNDVIVKFEMRFGQVIGQFNISIEKITAP